MRTVLTYRAASPAEAAAVARVARQLAGRAAAPPGLAARVFLPAALALLSKVQQAFLVKSRGGTGDDGIRWAPLSPKTIAARRTTRSELKALGVGGKRVRGLLTPDEDRRWRAIFAGRLAAFRARGMGDGEAMARAAANAWAILKRQGAKTKLEVLGSRKVDIGRDTGALLRSLTPVFGVAGAPAPVVGTFRAPAAGAVAAPGGVLEVGVPGRFTVGSAVPYAAAFHARRPLWPRDGLPPAWREAVGAALLRALAAEAGRGA